MTLGKITPTNVDAFEIRVVFKIRHIVMRYTTVAYKGLGLAFWKNYVGSCFVIQIGTLTLFVRNEKGLDNV